MSKDKARSLHVVLERYRTGGRWKEQGETMKLLPVEAQGPASQGNIVAIDKQEDAAKVVKAHKDAKAEAAKKRAAAIKAAESKTETGDDQ